MWLAAAISVQHKMHISLGSSPRFTIDPSYLTSLSLSLFLYKMRIATIPTILYGSNEISRKSMKHDPTHTANTLEKLVFIIPAKWDP